MQPVMVQPKKYVKEQMKTTVEIPQGRERESTYPFQWLLFKPQAHAVTPFETNAASRDANTTRK
jgi:hypothetical protein